MSVYGERLKKYIKDSGLSVRKLAAEANIDRTLLQRYLSGERLSKNVKEVRYLSECLMLSPENQENLIESYNQTRYGLKKYESFLMIRDMLSGMVDFRVNYGSSDTDSSKDKMTMEIKQKGSKACIGKMEIENMLRVIMRSQHTKNGRLKVQIISQPEVEILLKTIIAICAGQNIDVEQIICLDEDSSEGNNNIKTIYSLFPMLFNNVSYQSFYYYDKKDAHINCMSLLPALILTGDAAMVCNYKMDEGLVFFHKENVNFYRRQYEKIKSRTSILTRYFTDNVPEWITFYKDFMTDLAVVEICIGLIPCITYALDENILIEVLCVNEKEKQSLLDIFLKNKEIIMKKKNKKTPVNIFTESGLRQFMETGRSNEYPENWYRPFSPMSRLLILERMILMSQNGYMEYIMTNPNMLTIDEKLLIYVNENVVFQYRQNPQLNQYFSVNEQGTRRSLQEFVTFAEENDWIYGSSKTIKKMEIILEEYKNR